VNLILYLTKLTDDAIKVYKVKDTNLKVSGISCDSRNIKKGMLFAAINGNKNTGSHYITDAFKAGAIALLCKKKDTKFIKKEISNILVCDNIRKAIAKIAKQFFPKQPENISAVTGTNGKTSVVSFLYEIWKKNKVKGASFGTLGIKYNGFYKKTRLTTLDAINLHKELYNLKLKKINFLAMEASSHALNQSRIDEVKIKFALFTNLSRDHLDYHKTMKNYFKSKSRLFKFLIDKKGVAVICADSSYGKKIKKICDLNNINNITYGFHKNNHWRILEVKRLENDTQVSFIKKSKIYKFKCRLIADFEIENLIGAIILANLNGLSINKVLKSVEKINQPKGRLRKVVLKNKSKSIYIDYAHTPAALKKSLKALRLVLSASGKLHLVFGCGGDRDKGKRQIMGKVADEFADKVFITDDNPRYENPKNIRLEIASHCKKAICIGNRKLAILKAIKSLEYNDILLIAGKGHENYQEVKGKVVRFDDELEVKKIINERTSL
jgi:UDP-N-acetylmuramyl-tripeptide synthetase